MKKIIVVLLPFLLFLFSCGRGDAPLPPDRPFSDISGHAVDALIVNGSLAVYDYEDGNKGELLGTTTTNEFGAYELSLQSKNRPVLLEITGGYYTEEASGKRVILKDGQFLHAVTFYVSGEPLEVMVTPFTNLAAGLVAYKLSQSANVSVAITEATSAITSFIGLDILGTYPRNITDPNNATGFMTDEHRYGFFTAGLSSLTQWISEQNNVDAHSIYTSIALVQLMYQDIATDGQLDGIALDNETKNSLSFGSVPLSANVYRADLAKQIIAIADSSVNKTGLGVVDVLDLATDISQTTHVVFAGIEPQPVDVTGPEIAVLEVEDLYKGGVFSFAVSVKDFVGLKSVTFDVDGDELGNAAVAANPTIEIYSTVFTDGDHLIGVRAIDNVGNESYAQYTVKIDNTNPFVNVTSPTIVKDNDYIVTGTYTDQGAGLDAIYVNGALTTKNTDGTWFKDLSLSPGMNTLAIKLIDRVGNLDEIEVDVALDVANPIMTLGYSDAALILNDSEYPGSLADLDINTGARLLLKHENLSTLGIEFNRTALNANNIPYISLTTEDPLSSGIATALSDLQVQYSYSVDGVLRTEFRDALQSTDYLDGGAYLFPFSNETLSSDWMQTSNDSVHTLSIKVVDNAGNITIDSFSFKAQFDLQDVTIISTQKGASANLYAFVDGIKGGLIGSCTTDNSGQCTYGLYTEAKPILVEVMGGNTIEAASGNSIVLGANEGYRSIVLFDSQDVTAIVTPLTHVAIGYFNHQNLQLSFDEAYAATKVSFQVTYGFDVFTTIPLDVTSASSLNPVLSAGHKYGFQLAALSEFSAWANIENGLPEHAAYNTYTLANAMYQDIVFDGSLNGNAIDGVLSLGSVVLSDYQYRFGVGTQLLAFTKSNANASGFDAASVFDYANHVAQSKQAIYEGKAGYDLDANGPLISLAIADTWQRGIIELAPEVSDDGGIASVSFEIDSNALGEAIDPAMPVYRLDTTAYNDGQHVVGFTAIDDVGNSSYRQFIVNFDNTAANISVTSSAQTGVANFIVTGRVTDEGAGIQSIVVNSVTADINEVGLWSANIMLDQEGNNNLVIVATDNVGNVASSNIVIMLDTTSPAYEVTSSSMTGNVLFIVTGSSSDTGTGVQRITVGDAIATINEAGTWSANVTLDQEGISNLAIEVTDAVGNVANSTIKITLDTTNPDYILVSENVSKESVYLMSGTAIDAGTGIRSLTIGGQVIVVNADGSWSFDTGLTNEGTNSYNVVLVDNVGNTVNDTISILRDTIVPTFTRTSAEEVATTSMIVSGTFVEDGSGLSTLTVAGLVPDVDMNAKTWNILLALEEGANNFVIEIKDNAGNGTVGDISVLRDTVSPNVVVTSTNYVGSASYMMTGTYVESGSGIFSIEVNGNVATINAATKTWSLSVSLSAGDNIFNIVATDNVDNQNITNFNVTFDGASPTRTDFYSLAKFSDGAGDYYAASMQTANPTSNPLYIVTDKLSSGSLATATEFDGVDIPYIGMNVRDGVLGSLNTPGGDIIAKMQYKINGVVKQAWKTLTPSPVSEDGSGYIIPISNEGLHSSWISTTSNDIHRIEIELTDAVGNQQNHVHEFKVEFIAPAISVSVSDVNSFTESFTNRTVIFNKEKKVNTYTFTNTSDTYMYIKTADSGVHTANNLVEQVIRENKVRLKDTRHWQVKTFSFDSVFSTICYAWPLSSWTDVNSLLNWNGGNWVTIKPSIIIGDIETVLLDFPIAPETSVWTNKSMPDSAYETIDSFQVDLKSGERYAFYYCSGLNNSNSSALNWQERSIYSYVPEPGYPLNTLTTFNTSADFSTARFEVRDSNNNIISTVSDGWYKASPGMTVTISKYVTVPLLPTYNDADVADMNAFSSYSLRKYDKTFTVNISRPIMITRAAGDSVGPKGRSFVTTEGSNAKIYTIGR